MSSLFFSWKHNAATSSQTKTSSVSSEWPKHYLEHNFRGKLAWCALPSILEPEKVHFCPSVSTQEPFSQVTAQAQLGICPEWSFLGEQSLHEDRFLFSSPTLGLPKCKNLRQVPLSMACNSSWGLPSGLGSACWRRTQSTARQMGQSLNWRADGDVPGRLRNGIFCPVWKNGEKQTPSAGGNCRGAGPGSQGWRKRLSQHGKEKVEIFIHPHLKNFQIFSKLSKADTTSLTQCYSQIVQV